MLYFEHMKTQLCLEGGDMVSKLRNITEDIVYLGASDRRLNLFENIFPIQHGVSYNSYLLKDEKTVLFDTVDYAVGKVFLESLSAALGGRTLDYLVINHMEPDHCALIDEITKRYPDVELIGNVKTFVFLHQFFDFDQSLNEKVVAEGDSFSTGSHTLTFVMAPMVHWPEAMVTYDSKDKVLFSADAFGTFGALSGNLFADEIGLDAQWINEYRRYYTNIVGKYGVQVQALLNKAKTLDIAYICPLHGPVFRKDFAKIIDLYDLWSKYEAEVEGVLICYASMYGHTEKVVNDIAGDLAANGVQRITMLNVSTTDVSELIAQAFKYSHLILASPTYNGNIYPKMKDFIEDMKALNMQKKKVLLVENGTWAPASARCMREILSQMKAMDIMEETITIRSSRPQTQWEDILTKFI